MRNLILLLLLLCTVPALAQVSLQFVPEVYGRSVDGLVSCRIVNPAGRKTASLTITVTERKAGTVLVLHTGNFTLMPGSNSLPAVAVRSASILYSNNPISVVVRRNKYFPEGEYEYCFALDFAGTTADAPAEQCFDYGLTPFAPLHLIEPYDRDTICDKRPLLSWQPLVPTLSGMNYQLVLTEIKSGQNATEALNYNLPILNQSHLLSPVLPYPAIANQLEEGKTYAWQVTAYQDQTILSRSETWEFKVQCREKKKDSVLTDDGYRDIEDLVKGNYYIAAGAIKFALLNPYKPGKFKYTIEPLNNPGKKVKSLPAVKLETGNNKIMIDLANTDSFTDGDAYVMKAWLPDGTIKSLRFIYKD